MSASVIEGRRVAVVGAGPGGIATAKHLLDAGFAPVLLEAADELGGQWNAGGHHSGVWPGMRANTSAAMTRFSDMDHAPGTPMFPSARRVHGYLRAYAERFGVAGRVRARTRVTEVRRDRAGWLVASEGPDGPARERYDAVVLASGRFRRPHVPAILGLDALARRGRVAHAAAYRGREELRGRRVLVVGNSISGLEIAADLARDDATRVLASCRAPRWIIPKVARGVAADQRWFTAFAELLGRALPPEALADGLRAEVLAEAGDPALYGGAAPPREGMPALSQSQDFLPMVAEGRIAVRPALARLDGDEAVFADGTRETVDVVLLATGYELDLPYLGDDVRAAIWAGDGHLDLHARTFHPDLPGLAVIGQFVMIGPYLPVLELQARLVAAAWSGVVPAAPEEVMRASIAGHRAMRAQVPVDVHHVLATRLAEELGVAPDPEDHAEIAAALLFGPMLPARWRLVGHGALPEAASALPPAPPVAAHQRDALRMLAGALGRPGLAEAAACRTLGR